MLPKNNLKDFIHLHFIVFIWGFTAVLGKLISIDAIPLVWYRISIASVILFLFLLIKKQTLKINPRAVFQYLLGGFIIGLHWITFFYAIKISNVSITLAAMATGALFTSFLEPLFLKRKLRVYEIAVSLVIVIGIVIIKNVEAQYTMGIIVALFSAFLSSLFTVINANFIKENTASLISFYELFFASILISFVLFWQQEFSVEFFKLTTNDWIFIAVLGSICTAYALTASTDLLKRISPFTIMLTVNLEPVYGIVLALFIFGDSEKMNTEFYYAAILILLAVIVNGIIKSKLKKR